MSEMVLRGLVDTIERPEPWAGGGIGGRGDAAVAGRSMRELMALRDAGQERLRAHPFYEWLRSPAVPLARKLDFLPAMTVFVMNFRDMNLWVIRFADADDPFKEVINGSTVEDETHSRLFLEDWRKLHFDDRLGWKPSDMLWWLFLSPDMEDFRRFGVEFMRLSVDDGGDPLVRFAHSEAGEACGHVFFEHVSPLADAVGRERDLTYRYLGLYHLERETGHVLGSEGVFEDQPLTAAQFERGAALADRMFAVFDGIHDRFFDYVGRYVETATPPRRTFAVRYSHPEDTAPVLTPSASPAAGGVHPSQRPLQRHLEARMAAAAAHPFYAWLRTATVPAHKKLQRFVPLWTFDILGYRDLNRYVFRYDEPASALESAVNAVCGDLETHSQLFLQDWIELGLDDVLRWAASDTLEFLFLDYFMDVHRRTLVHFAMLGLAHRDPFERLWFVEALEASGHAFFEHTRAVALEAERDQGMRLDYLAGRHATVHRARGAGAAVAFRQLPVERAEQLDAVHHFIDVVFDALDRNLTLSLQAAEDNKFAVR